MTVKTTEETWHDKGRGRDIPVKIYWPASQVADPEFSSGSSNEIPNQVRDVRSPPLVIFSHGIGGDRGGYKYLSEYLARHGFAVINPTHLGIDASLMKGERPFQNLKQAANDPEYLHILPEDIHFMLDYISYKEMKFDMERIAMAGHSFGSYVTLAVAGQSVSRDGVKIRFKDERIKCAVALSPLATRQKPETAYDKIEIPILHITGLKDDSPFGLLDPAERRVPFDNMNKTDQYLVTFNHADHLIFAAQRRQNKFSTEDVKILELTADSVMQFLKKYLLNDKSAIDAPEFLAKLEGHATLEIKVIG